MATRLTLAVYLLSLFNTTSLAQQQQPQTILSLPFYGYNDGPVAASVIAADAIATTLSLGCPPPSTPSSTNDYGESESESENENEETECTSGPPYLTLIHGPSTWHMDLSAAAYDDGWDIPTMTQDCNIRATICVESWGGEGANGPGFRTKSYEGWEVVTLGVRITAGMEKLVKATMTGSGSGKASSSLTTRMGGSATTTTSKSASATSATSVSTGSSGSDSGGSGRAKPEGLGVVAAFVGFIGVFI
ncbi:uncharacterized protein RCC_04656 [Ramularia collo-cygni]|uniref:Uncharacterized protein n=1 Tax=Ramularia collo-cygni TaxID=112498 RepID=A0A2D3UQ18_9PEZI|nr:uncharacterized protein RCC_04656 [Ramularia collo-cygni]CZT18812.1 uncharacterized protein RCC_04656 [Ramularia collo-cygni]